MIQAIKNWLSPRKIQSPADLQQRSYESGATTELNERQWVGVGHSPINAEIATKYQTFVNRCVYEYRNNPIVSGVAKGYAIDVVGRRGPHLIINSSDENYNAIVKQIWQDWFSDCCVDGISGVELLKRLVRQLWSKGDWLQQLVDLGDELPFTDPVKFRLMDIEPLRLWDDSFVTDSIAGIKRDQLGRPVSYKIRDELYQSYLGYNSREIPARDIIHAFESEEPGQIRGIPILANCLQEIRDLRDYDDQVLDAARAAANNGFLMTTGNDEIIESQRDLEVPDRITFERQVVKKIPAGWDVKSQTPTQPIAQYQNFRHEKLRSLGRVKHIPLLSVLLSAEDSNFSQSRIDLNVIYQRGLNDQQQWIESRWLNKLLDQVMREAVLATDAGGFIVPPRPNDLTIKWGWEPLPQANPKDHVKVQRERMELGLTSPEIELANEGVDEDDVILSLKRSKVKRDAAQLNLPLPNLKQENPNEQDQQEDEEASQETESQD